ncbi:hypothetical protein DV735_g4914, partial [Chaetothyriales sp. CBS 134920]
MAIVFVESYYGTETKEDILASLLEVTRKHGSIGHYRYHVEFPLLDDSDESPLPCREPPDVFEVFNSSFGTSINKLFDALQEFERLSKTHDGDGLVRKKGLSLEICVNNQSFARSRCYHRLFHSRRLFLRDPAALPDLQSVTKLGMGPYRYGGCRNAANENVRPVSLRVPLELMTHLPALRELECRWMWEHMPIAFTLQTLRQLSWPWAGPWRDSRHEFGEAVQQLHDQFPSSFTKARLWFWQPHRFSSDDNQGLQLPDLIRPAEADPFSLGLRTLASHLEELDLRAIVTPDLFRAPIAWPRMKRLRVEFHPWCPDGTWYFVGPRGENPYPEGGYEITPEEHYPPVGYHAEDDAIDEEYEEQEGTEEEEERDTDAFRIEPSQHKIELLLSAFAEALKGMPALEEAELFTYLNWEPSSERQAEYEGIDEEPFNRADPDTNEICAIYRWSVSYIYTPGKDGGLKLSNST